MSDSLWPHGLQHAGLPCPSYLPELPQTYVHSLSWWYHPNISSFVIPFSSCLKSFPASGSFPVSQFFESGGQSTGASPAASVLPINIQDWFPLGLNIWSPCSPRDSQESSPAPQFKSISSSVLSLYGPALTSICDYWKNRDLVFLWKLWGKLWGFPHNSVSKEYACNAGDLGSIPGSERSPRGGEAWQLHVFLPRESHGQRSLAGHSP